MWVTTAGQGLWAIMRVILTGVVLARMVLVVGDGTSPCERG